MKKSFLKGQRNPQNRREDGAPYKHDLGQHFLYDQALLSSLVTSTGLTREDNVLEIGPGSGALTACLCQSVRHVLAVEADGSILPLLRVATASYPNLSIVQGDIRRQNLPELCAPLGNGFFVVANIPYNITTPILDMLLGSKLPIRQVSVMVQKEVAEKLLATPADDGYGPLSVKCQYYCQPELAAIVPAEAFTPPPKVDSAFVHLPFRKQPPLPVQNERLLFQLVKAGFGMRRKTLLNALKGAISLDAESMRDILAGLNLPPTVRGEALSIEEWIHFANACQQRLDEL